LQPKQSFFESVRLDAGRHLKSWNRGYGLGSYLRLIFLCPGFQLAFSLRVQSVLVNIPVIGAALRRILWYFTTIWFSCDIDPGARFGPGIYFPHPTGIVIGGEWDVGSNVTILQSVTLGRGNESPIYRPRICDGVLITAGAKIIGAVNIGAGAVIGANAVVLHDVPSGAVAAGVPAKVVSNSRSARVAKYEYDQTVQ
jgi:serine O-acetyltransferase